MTEFYTDKTDAGKSLEAAITRRYGYNAKNRLWKALRNKDVKIDGKRTGKNEILSEGLLVTLYEDFRKQSVNFKIVFENENFLVAEKPQGIPVNKDSNDEETLIESVKKNIYSGCELCHRIDRNTGGLVVISKTEQACGILREMFEAEKKEIVKYYTCIVSGKLPGEKSQVVLNNYLFKDNKKSLVYIYDEQVKGSVFCSLAYESLKYDPAKNISDVKVRLLTGRTHQIRAQLAHIGHPIVGDGKYGREAINRQFGFKYQALWCAELLIPAADDLFGEKCLNEIAEGKFKNVFTVRENNRLYVRIISKANYK